MSTDATPNGQDLAGKAQEKAHEAVEQAQAKAHEATGQARSKVREQLDQRTSQAAEQINQQGSDLRTVGQSLREQGKETPARAADTLAQYAEKAGGYLQNKDADALLSDLEAFGRRQPWALGLGGLALGFAASRFLKASSNRRYSVRSGAPSAAPSPPARNWPTAPAPVPAGGLAPATQPLGAPVTAPMPPAPPAVPARGGV
jgi:hypothetical protein